MHRFLGFALVLPVASLLFACGKGASDARQQDDDSGFVNILNDSGSPGCTGEQPPCVNPCSGDAISATCQGGQWLCPDYMCPIVTEDAGTDACSAYPLPCSALTYCAGVYQIPSCSGGAWSCIWVGQCDDGGVPVDASPPEAGPDATTGQPFACGDLACDPATSYCRIITGGPVSEDGGTSSSYACVPNPPACAPGPATCACVAPEEIDPSCACLASNANGDVILVCDFP